MCFFFGGLATCTERSFVTYAASANEIASCFIEAQAHSPERGLHVVTKVELASHATTCLLNHNKLTFQPGFEKGKMCGAGKDLS